MRPKAWSGCNHGLELDGEPLKPARVSWQNEHQLRFVLRQGKKRQIRRMCELVGLEVTGLKRVRTGSVRSASCRSGKWRYLRADRAILARGPANRPRAYLCGSTRLLLVRHVAQVASTSFSSRSLSTSIEAAASASTATGAATADRE